MGLNVESNSRGLSGLLWGLMESLKCRGTLTLWSRLKDSGRLRDKMSVDAGCALVALVVGRAPLHLAYRRGLFERKAGS